MLGCVRLLLYLCSIVRARSIFREKLACYHPWTYDLSHTTIQRRRSVRSHGWQVRKEVAIHHQLCFARYLELSLAFCKTYAEFIVCRVLFGWVMGGIYGNATTTALEDCPKNARALVAGLYQSGHSLGFLLATAFWAAFNPHWKHLFYFAACPPLLLMVF